MRKEVGILYDNISGNTGDSAVGISVRRMLADFRVPFKELVPGRFSPEDYKAIVVGGGYLLRPGADFFYDRFRVPGPHILNSCGIVGNPDDLKYLNDYLYVSVRSQGDKRKISYLTNEVEVVPCTAMLLKDLADVGIEICRQSIGLNLGPGLIDEPESLAKYLSRLPFHIYLLPITHYNHDFEHLARLHTQVRNSTLLPVLKPEEIFTVIGKFDYFVSASLHGAIFSYVHNVPFILSELDEKMTFFMEERGIDEYLFKSFDQLEAAFDKLSNKKPDYSQSLDKDFQILEDHKEKIKDILSAKDFFVVDSELAAGPNELEILRGELQESNMRIQYLRKQVECLRNQLHCAHGELRYELDAIHNSRGWKLLCSYYRFRDMILPHGSIRRVCVKRFVALAMRTIEIVKRKKHIRQ